MHQLQLNNRTLLLVPVPEGATDIEHKAISNTVEFWFISRITFCASICVLPPGSGWQFIAVTEALTEEQAAGLVKQVIVDLPPSAGNDWCGDWKTAYLDYAQSGEEDLIYSEYPYVDTALASFRSFLSAHNITGNHAILQRND